MPSSQSSRSETLSRHIRAYSAHRAASERMVADGARAHHRGHSSGNALLRYRVEPLKVLGIRVGWKVVTRG